MAALSARRTVPDLSRRCLWGSLLCCFALVIVGTFRLDGTPASHGLALRSSQAPAVQDPCLLYSELYQKYATDLVRVRQLAARFCAQATDQQKGTPHVHHCLTGDLESEVLYLRIRHFKPANVFEVSSALGYSTMWILAALEDNGHGVLHSFDLFETPFPHVLGDSHRGRWEFHHGDMLTTFKPIADSVPVDYLHIDTCHDESCIRWYLHNVLEVVAAQVHPSRPVHTSMHDIYETYYSPAGVRPAAQSKRLPLQEGNQVFEWLAFARAGVHMHTLGAGLGKVGECVRSARQDALHDEAAVRVSGMERWNGDLAASIYFQLMPLTDSCKDCIVS